MAEIDLIPPDYRLRLQRQSMLRSYGIGLLVVNAALVILALAIGQTVNARQEQATELRTANALTRHQQEQLDQLRAQRIGYEEQWSLLRGLRAGAEIGDIFELVDRSLVDDRLWFSDWSFRRAGVLTDAAPRGTETGYFVVVDSEQARDDESMKVETHMSVSGQASDHQALSRFVRKLFEQADVRDVSVQKTSQLNVGNARIVEFDLTVVLNSAARSSG